ncbi:MAG TPA: hypothetical protein VNA28_10290 [Solirubrobacteraceae bacterium]|nr:hypothetical protein [Solirubrobacteraceae bacterium]
MKMSKTAVAILSTGALALGGAAAVPAAYAGGGGGPKNCQKSTNSCNTGGGGGGTTTTQKCKAGYVLVNAQCVVINVDVL